MLRNGSMSYLHLGTITKGVMLRAKTVPCCTIQYMKCGLEIITGDEALIYWMYVMFINQQEKP